MFSQGFCTDDEPSPRLRPTGATSSSAKATEDGSDQGQFVSELAAEIEKIAAGALSGVIAFWIAHSLKAHNASKAAGAVGGFALGYLLDAYKGYLPPKTASAFAKLGISLAMVAVSDDDPMKKIDQLQGCAIAFLKSLIEQHGSIDNAQKAVGDLKKEKLTGHNHFKRVDGAKKGRIYRMKVNFDKYEEGKKKLEGDLEKLEQVEHMLNFKKCFDEHAASVKRAKVLRAKNGEPKQSADELQKKLEELKKQQKKLPFRCVEDGEFEKLEKETHNTANLLKDDGVEGLSGLVKR